MSWEWVLIIATIALLISFASSLDVGVSLGLIGLIGLLLFKDPQTALATFGNLIYATPRKYLLTAVPLFVFMADLVMRSGMGADLFSAFEKVIGRIPAGLGVATQITSAFMAAVTGVSIASCAALAPMVLSEMVIKRGYKKSFSAGCIAAGGALAIIIPPSLAFIVYGFVTETSVPALFVAGLIPGLILCGAYIIMILIWGKVDKHLIAPTPHLSEKTKAPSLMKSALPMFGLAAIMLGAIYTGWATPTESAALGLGAFFLWTTINRKITWAALRESMFSTAETTAAIMLVVIGASVFSYLLSYAFIPARLAELIAGLNVSPMLIMIAVNVLLLIAGCLMDTTSLLLVMIPLLLPVLNNVGFTDKVWLGLVLCLNIEIGLMTPPVGLNLFIMEGIGKTYGVTYMDTVKGVWPFVGVNIFILGLIIAFPGLTHIL